MIHSFTMKNWNAQLLALAEFRKAYPSRFPATSTCYPKKNPLGLWCKQQRKDFWEGALSESQVQSLFKLGLFSSKQALLDGDDSFFSKWFQRFYALLCFKKRENRLPSSVSTDTTELSLQMWLHFSRKRYGKGSLKPDCVKLLKTLDIKFKAPESFEERWDQHYKMLKEFWKAKGRWPLVSDKYPKDQGIGKWAHTQRISHLQGKLSKSRLKQLQKIGFLFESHKETLWMTYYQKLKEYRKLYPNQWPTLSKDFPGNNNLCVWTLRQRRKNKQGKLEPLRKSLLDKLGVPFEIRDADAWMKHFKCLVAYKKKYPKRWPTNIEIFKGVWIGTWCFRQQKQAKSPLYSKARRNLLAKIGFPFNHLRGEGWRF